MNRKKVIFISGPITGVARYWEAFEEMEDELSALGFIPLSPSRLPADMTFGQYTRICLAMIDCADAVVFLPGWNKSPGSRLEREYCIYTEKQTFMDPHFIKEVLGC